MQLQNKERDLIKYMLRTCSVATNLVTSLEVAPICCATMLCLFDLTRQGSLGTHFIHFSTIAMSSDTSDYVAVPERVVQNEEPANRTEKRFRNKLSSALKKYLNGAQWNLMYLKHAIMYFYHYLT